jgi:hypothetical protein
MHRPGTGRVEYGPMTVTRLGIKVSWSVVPSAAASPAAEQERAAARNRNRAGRQCV